MKKTILTIAILFSLATILTHAEVVTMPAEIIGLDDRFETHVLVKSTAIVTQDLDKGQVEVKYLRTFVDKRIGDIELTQVYVGFYHFDSNYRNYDRALMVGGYDADIIELEKFLNEGGYYEAYGIEVYQSEIATSATDGLPIKLKSRSLNDTVVEISPELFTEHIKQLEYVMNEL